MPAALTALIIAALCCAGAALTLAALWSAPAAVGALAWPALAAQAAAALLAWRMARRSRPPPAPGARLDELGRLAGLIAHEVNNERRAAAALLARGDTARAARALDTLGHITDQALAFSRPPEDIAAGRERIHAADMLAALRFGLAEYLELAGGGTARLHVTLDRTNSPVAVSGLSYRGMLVNLVNNAGEAGARTVWIRQRQTAGRATDRAAGPGLETVVEDDGPGVPPALADSLFEPWATGRPGRGTGFGLATVRRYAEAAGGHVTHAPARPGHPRPGARFTLWLPLAPPPPE